MNTLMRIIVFALGFISSTAFAKPVKVPEFNLPTNSGMVSQDSFKGKVLYVDFWASWCRPCAKSFPWLNKMQEKYKDEGLVILGINVDKDKAKAERFLELIPANFMIAYDSTGNAAEAFKLKGMPSSYMVGRDGSMLLNHVGFREKDEKKLEQLVDKLIKGK